MKTIVASVVSLLVRLAIGCLVGYRYYERHITNEGIQMMVDGGESSDALIAATSARAIGFIDSGETQKAIETLTHPIAHYYFIYGRSRSTNEQHLKLRAMIDELARTNQTVAAQIAAKETER